MSTLDTVFSKPFKNGKRAASKKVDNNTYAELRAVSSTDGALVPVTVQEWEAADPTDRGVAIRLHETDVVTWVADGRIVLNTGGWKSTVTKTRINDWLPVGWYVFSVKGEWRVVRHNGDDRQSYPYADGFELRELLGVYLPVPGTYPDVQTEQQLREARAKLRKDIKVYVAKLGTVAPVWAAKLREDGSLSTAGDCFYCRGIVTTPDGAVAQDVDHLWAHLREGYIFPTLVINAYRAKGYSNPEVSFSSHISYYVSNTQKVVSAYLLKALGESSVPSVASTDRVKLEQYVSSAVEVLEKPQDFGYFGSDDTLWNTSAPTWTKHRDSSNEDIANFEVVWNALAAEFPELLPEDLDDDHLPARNFNPGALGALYVFGAGHWAVGHIDQIVVPVKLDGTRPVDVDNLHPAFIRVCEFGAQVRAYPVLAGAEPVLARLQAEDQRSEARQYLADPTEENVEKLIAAVLQEQDGEWPDFMEAEGWLAVVLDLGLEPEGWLERYRAE